MTEQRNIIIVVESWRLALLAVKRDILDAEPVAALRRLDAMLDQIACCKMVHTWPQKPARSAADRRR